MILHNVKWLFLDKSEKASSLLSNYTLFMMCCVKLAEWCTEHLTEAPIKRLSKPNAQPRLELEDTVKTARN